MTTIDNSNKIFVTGASGFLGQHLLSTLKHRGFEYTALSRTSDEEGFVQGDILDEAGVKASEEAAKKIKLAEQEVEQLSMRLKESLKKDLSKLVVEGAEMILKKEIDKQAHDKAIKDLINKI